MALDATTGEWTYRPQESGEHALVLEVSDGRFTVERRVQVTVPDPEAPTRFSGRLLDADSLAQGVERPYVDPFDLEPDCKYCDKRCYEDGGFYYCTCTPEVRSWSWWPLSERAIQCIQGYLQQKGSQCDPTPGERGEEGVDTGCNLEIHWEGWSRWLF